MAKLYTYMMGIEPSSWTKRDENMCAYYDIVNKGYYRLGDEEGMILVGTLKNLKDIMKDYFDYIMVDDYLCPIDFFDFEDGVWLTGGWYESKKSVRKSIKESRETIKISIPSNKELIGFLRPMEYGLTSAQLMTSVGGNWAWIDNPAFGESGYMYIHPKTNLATKIQYDFAKVHTIDIDWGNHQIYFYTKGDTLMLHFYDLSDEEFNFLINGDEHLDGIVTRFGK